MRELPPVMVPLKVCPTLAMLRSVIGTVPHAGPPSDGLPKIRDSELSPGVDGVVVVTSNVCDAPGASTALDGDTEPATVWNDCDVIWYATGPLNRSGSDGYAKLVSKMTKRHVPG